jgi:hypothetical protein
MAAFHSIIYGRFWVITEARSLTGHPRPHPLQYNPMQY